MIAVSEILDDVAESLGVCKDDTPLIFRRLTSAVKLLAAKGEWDPLQAEVSISVVERCFALPRDVETVLGVLIDGRPSVGRDRYFEYHINGPGEHTYPDTPVGVVTDSGYAPCGSFGWLDRGSSPTFFDLPSPCRVGYCFRSAIDASSNNALSFYGLDEFGNRIENINLDANCSGYSVGSGSFSVIDRIRKPATLDLAEVKAYPVDGSAAFTISFAEGPDTEPRFRRISIGPNAAVVRIAYRRKTFRVASVDDLIPLHSEFAIVAAVKAVRHYLGDNPALAAEYEATATRLLSEEEFVRTPPVGRPIQVSGLGAVLSGLDTMS